MDICAEVELLDHMVHLLLVFWEASMLLDTVVAPIYIPTNSVGGFSILHILTNICYLCSLFLVMVHDEMVKWYKDVCISALFHPWPLIMDIMSKCLMPLCIVFLYVYAFICAFLFLSMHPHTCKGTQNAKFEQITAVIFLDIRKLWIGTWCQL